MSTFILSLNILHKKRRNHFKILLFAFQAVHGIAPKYDQNLLSLKS